MDTTTPTVDPTATPIPTPTVDPTPEPTPTVAAITDSTVDDDPDPDRTANRTASMRLAAVLAAAVLGAGLMVAVAVWPRSAAERGAPTTTFDGRVTALEAEVFDSAGQPRLASREQLAEAVAPRRMGLAEARKMLAGGVSPGSIKTGATILSAVGLVADTRIDDAAAEAKAAADAKVAATARATAAAALAADAAKAADAAEAAEAALRRELRKLGLAK